MIMRYVLLKMLSQGFPATEAMKFFKHAILARIAWDLDHSDLNPGIRTFPGACRMLYQ